MGKLNKLVDWIIPIILALIVSFTIVVSYLLSSLGESSYAIRSFVVSPFKRVVILQEMPALSKANEWFVFIEQGGKRKWIYAGCSDSGGSIKKISWDKMAQLVGVANDDGWQIGYDFSHAITVGSPSKVKAAFRNAGEEIFPYPDKVALVYEEISPAEAQKWLRLAPENAPHNSQ